MSGERAVPTTWEVRPDGIEDTRFADPESFYLTIRRAHWQGETTYVVSQGARTQGAFTKNGVHVYLRHDVNAKHAHHATLDDAIATATAIADGDLRTRNYRYWRDAERQHFGPPTTQPRTPAGSTEEATS